MTKEAVRTAEQMLADRRRRDQVFAGHAEGFGEPAWDMLLTLYVADEGSDIPPDTLITKVKASATSGRLYLRWLEREALIVSDLGGVRLTSRGRELMGRFLAG